MHAKTICDNYLYFLFYTSISQDIDGILQDKSFNLSGSISTNQTFNSSALNQRYFGVYSGFLNLSYRGISMPFSFIYSNSQGTFSHPFNQVALHPSYKWIKAHIGTVSMSLSPYTVNGHLFNGLGLELTPEGPFKASLLAGRFIKAVEFDSTRLNTRPSFKRSGYGIKLGYTKNEDFIDIIFFKARDDQSSLDSMSTQGLSAQENAVVGISGGKQVFENLLLSFEYGSTGITGNIQNAEVGHKINKVRPAALFLNSKESTIFRKAFNANLQYKLGNSSLGLRYERVDPEYRTFGTYFFTNNLENATINFVTAFAENKITLNGNAGLQKDNLDENNLNNTKRFVGSANINYVPIDKINLNLSYSNFLSYTNVRSSFDYINQVSPLETWDTLNYRQISQNINFNSSYQVKSTKQNRQTVVCNLTMQNSKDQSGSDSSNISNFINFSSNYIIAMVPSNFTISSSLNYTSNQFGVSQITTWGPGVSLNKLFFNKILRTSLSTFYNSTHSENANTNIWNIRLGTTLAIKNQHNVNLNVLYQARSGNSSTANSSRNTSLITLGYVYNFNLFSHNQAE